MRHSDDLPGATRHAPVEIYHAPAAASRRRAAREIELQRAWSLLPPGARLEPLGGASAVVVRHPGVWNRAGGPDFTDAVLVVDGAAVRGDVELHLRQGDWNAHGHGDDPRYANVVLHAVARPGGAAGPPLVAAAPVRTPGRHARADGRGGRPGDCGLMLASLGDAELAAFFEAEGARRFFAKSERFSALAMAGGAPMAFLRGLFEACGYKNNTEPFLALFARAAPRLAPDGADAEAILWGESGLLPATGLAGLPESQRAFAARVWEAWWPLRRDGAPPLHWRKGASRPANAPARRVAALAALLRGRGARGLYEELAAAVLSAAPGRDGPSPWTRIQRLLTVRDPLWDGFSDFGVPMSAPAACLGGARALDIAANALLPCLHADLELAGRPEAARLCLAVWGSLPPPQPNAVVRTAASRWMIPLSRGRRVFRTLAAAQGCLAAFERLCRPPGGDCEACARRLGAPGVFAAAAGIERAAAAPPPESG